jgi:hypothetical protein
MAVVKMLAKITGTRNGQEWPGPWAKGATSGETIELPDDEANALVKSKLAEITKRTPDTIVAADHVEHPEDPPSYESSIDKLVDRIDRLIGRGSKVPA